MTWIYTQLRSVPSFSHIILTGHRLNLDSFPWEPIVPYPNQIYAFLVKVMKEIGYRLYPRSYHEAIRIYEPKLLHSHFGNRGWYDISITKKYKLKHLVTFYGSDVSMVPAQSPVWRTRYQELFNHADLFLCEGPYMLQSLINLGCPAEKLVLQRLGIWLNKIPFKPRMIGDNEEIKILIAGSFREKKGIPYALEAVGILKNKYPDLRVTLIGDSTGRKKEELEKKKIMAIIKEYGLQSIVKMMGYMPYPVLLEEAYKHHIFLSPSVSASDGDTEGGAPITIIEMAASGMPVISTNHCDIPEVFDKRCANLLAEERDVAGIVERLDWLINNSNRWFEFLVWNRNHIEKRFNAEHQGMKLSKIYGSLLS